MPTRLPEDDQHVVDKLLANAEALGFDEQFQRCLARLIQVELNSKPSRDDVSWLSRVYDKLWQNPYLPEQDRGEGILSQTTWDSDKRYAVRMMLTLVSKKDFPKSQYLCYLQEEDPPEDHALSTYSCVCGRCYQAAIEEGKLNLGRERTKYYQLLEKICEIIQPNYSNDMDAADEVLIRCQQLAEVNRDYLSACEHPIVFAIFQVCRNFFYGLTPFLRKKP